MRGHGFFQDVLQKFQGKFQENFEFKMIGNLPESYQNHLCTEFEEFLVQPLSNHLHSVYQTRLTPSRHQKNSLKNKVRSVHLILEQQV